MSNIDLTNGVSANSLGTDPADDPAVPLQPEKSLGDLVSQVSADFSDLVHTQIELAKVELKEEATQAAKGAGMMAGAGAVAYLAVIILSMALGHALGEIMPVSVGFLIVGLIWAAVAAVLALRGKKQMQAIEPAPQTKESLKEDVQWARQQRS